MDTKTVSMRKKTTTKGVISLWSLSHAIFQELYLLQLHYLTLSTLEAMAALELRRTNRCETSCRDNLVDYSTRNAFNEFSLDATYCVLRMQLFPEGTPHQVPSCASENLRNRPCDCFGRFVFA